jgi:hypothetical protein
MPKNAIKVSKGSMGYAWNGPAGHGKAGDGIIKAK